MDGLNRSSASTRDRVRRRVLALTVLVGLTAGTAVGGLLVSLPADAGTAPAVQDPVATSGAS